MQFEGQSWKKDRLNKTCMEVVKLDLKKCYHTKDLAQNGLEQRNKIHVFHPITPTEVE